MDRIGNAFFICMLILAAFLAWRNIRLGRGDTRGAFRLAAFVWSMQMLWWLCSASHVPTAHEFVSFMEALNVFFASCRPGLDFLRSAGAVRKAALATDHDRLEPLTRRRSARPPGGGTCADRHRLGSWTPHLALDPIAFWQQSGTLSFQGPPLVHTAGRPAHGPGGP